MFKVGDEVVCVDALSPNGKSLRSPLKCGESYTVIAVRERCCSMKELAVPNPAEFRACSKCGARDAYWHYHKWRFIKLPKLTVDQEDEVTA